MDDITENYDIDFEEDIVRNPYNIKYWINYLTFKAHASARDRNLLHERALKALPGSYKIWFQYLNERVAQVQKRCITDQVYEAVNNTFERALVFLNKMPRIWIEYLKFLVKQRKVTQARKTFDRCLRALPITQHDPIWKLYLGFIQQDFIPSETALRVWRRLLQYDEHRIEDYIDFLKHKERWREVMAAQIKMLNNPNFISMRGATYHEMWVQLCQMLAKHPQHANFDNGLNAETIIRCGIQKFSGEVGQLWCALADFNIRLSRFEMARDVYEEGISQVTTVKDFGQVFDSYQEFEEMMLEAKMEATTKGEEDISAEKEDVRTATVLHLCGVEFSQDDELALRMDRLEHLLDRRPELLNSVLLRQNPHNVLEWHERVKIFKGKPDKVVVVYTEALSIVDPFKAIGKPHSLWVGFAKFYEKHIQDLDTARLIFEKAVKVNFRSVDDLASIWCEYAEFEIRHKQYAKALELMRRATATNAKPSSTKYNADDPVQTRVWRSVKLWSFYADLSESMGTVSSTKAVYDRMIDLKVATPSIVLNYAEFLFEQKYYEDAFKALERGVHLFDYPQVFDIWVKYLSEFCKRYKGTKLERGRDLFEQAVSKVPASFARVIFLLYAQYEEQYGLTKHAMHIYERAASAVEPGEKAQVYKLYISKASQYFDLTKTRQIYESAMENLQDDDIPPLAIRYADMERSLGEVDRARALYTFASQFCDPNVKQDFWDLWRKFEVEHGNEDTFLEMMRVRRSVQATFQTQVGYVSGGTFNPTAQEPAEEPAAASDDVEPADKPSHGLGAAPGTEGIKFVQPVSLEEMAMQDADGNELDISGDENESSGRGKRPRDDLVEKPVPDEVFGGYAKNRKTDD